MSSVAAMGIGTLDAMPQSEAAPLLASCCGAAAWIRGMLDRRPFGSIDAALGTAADVWWALGPADWREAFAHHPRIGEGAAAVAQDARARQWSAREQHGVAQADAEIRARLVEGNREYERRFGHIFLVCATGKSAAGMLELLRERLQNDPATELRIAAAEQAKITALRLRRLLGAE